MTVGLLGLNSFISGKNGAFSIVLILLFRIEYLSGTLIEFQESNIFVPGKRVGFSRNQYLSYRHDPLVFRIE